jgi:hypothetical protein
MRTEPSASVINEPRITAPKSATESGSVPEDVKKLTFTSLGF